MNSRHRSAPGLVYAVWIAVVALGYPAPAQIPPVTAQTPRIQWVRQFGSNRFDQAHAVGYGEFGVYTAGAAEGAIPGQESFGGKDAYISLHDESGNLKWARQFGTPGEDVATGVAGDGSGAYVVGYTNGAIGSQVGFYDSFIRKYDPNGDVLWTRQFGTVTDDYAYGVATHTSGVYVVGEVNCCGGTLPGQPTPPPPGTYNYVRKYDGDGTELWTRLISAEIEHAYGVAVDTTGVYVVGTTTADLAGPRHQRDGYLRKYSHDGAVLWTRQFGFTLANGDFATDDAFAVAASPAGVFVAGATAQGQIPGSTFAGGQWDAYVAKFDTDGAAQWVRQIGTQGDDYAYSIAVGAGHVLVGGVVGADLVPEAFVGNEDAFLRMYDFDGNVLGTIQFGNGLNDSALGIIAVPSGFYVAGTKSGDAFDQQPLGDNDAFLMKIIPPPFLSADAVLNAASFANPAPLAPGSIAIVFGAYLNDGQQVLPASLDLNDGPQVLSASLDADGTVVTFLGGTRVLVNNILAPILYSTPSQVAIQIPYELAGQSVASVVVDVRGQFSEERPIGIAPAAPGIFTQNQAGTGPAVVFHQDGVTLATPQDPVRPNEVVTLYTTGLGVLNPALGTGVPAGANLATQDVSIAFGSASGTIEYAGAAPDLVGLNQISARVPAGAPLGAEVPISLIVGGQSANPVVVAIGQ